MPPVIDYGSQRRQNSHLVRQFLNRASELGQAIRLEQPTQTTATVIWQRPAQAAAAFTGAEAEALLHEATDLTTAYPELRLTREQALLFVVQTRSVRLREGLS